MPDPRKPLYTRLFGWWYLCLGLAFASLAWRNVLLGGAQLGIAMRCVVAAGFLILGVTTLRAKPRGR